jgi:hypothetical protein
LLAAFVCWEKKKTLSLWTFHSTAFIEAKYGSGSEGRTRENG